MTSFRLPDVGEGLPDAEIIAWHVSAGDHVVADQPLVSIETDKAVVEIPSPTSGHIAQLCAKPGDIIAVGEVLVEFAEGATADTGAIVGDIKRSTTVPVTRPSPTAGRATEVRASPAVRAEARRRGVDLSAVKASGVQGTVSLADLDAAAADSAGVQPEPLRGVRRAMAANMAAAHAAVVPATVTDEADIGAWATDQDATLRLVRAIAAACAAEPALNMRFHGPETGRSPNRSVDLGIAMDTADGLFVPVLHDVANRSPEDLRAGLDALKADVQARSVPAHQLRGQTVTLSNFGMFGGRHAALVVVPPQVAIVGAGRIRDAVLAVEGQSVVRPVLPVSLTFDHRVVMGAEAARFLATLITDLEAR